MRRYRSRTITPRVFSASDPRTCGTEVSGEAEDAASPSVSGRVLRVGIAAPGRLARLVTQGAGVGALGAAADGLRAVLLPGAHWSVSAEIALGCAVVYVLAGIVLTLALGSVWALTDGLGRRLLRAQAFLPPKLSLNLPLATLFLIGLHHDSADLFSGPGISRTQVGLLAPWLFPLFGSLLGILLLRVSLAVHARLRLVKRSLRMGIVLICLALAALLVRAERLPQLDTYSALRRYCVLGAFLSAIFGLALFTRAVSSSAVRPPRTHTIGCVIFSLVLCLSLPFLFPDNSARLAIASRRFVACPAIHAVRRFVDFDHDGFSPLLGGGDCNDFNRNIHPFNRDVPGDGIDQDCDGVDGWRPEPLNASTPYGAPDAPAVTDLRALTAGKNVLIILVDAMRFDRLQGAHAGDFPHLTDLFHRSVSFTRALSSASRTPLAIPALLDGDRLPGPGTRLFRDLHMAGFHTGFVALDVLMEQLDLAKRFDGQADLVGISTEGERSSWGGGVHIYTGHAIADSALRWLDIQQGIRTTERGRPWLLWVHYFSAHQWEQIQALKSGRSLTQRYDAALADDDRGAGELLDGLSSRGLLEKTLVVLAADHGESLGDHEWRTHGLYLYSELVHVPLSILIPGVPPRSLSTPVPAAALTPTLLDLVAGIRPETESLPSLVPLIAGVAPPSDGAPFPIIMQDSLQDAIALDRRVLRFTPSENATELFSLDDLDAATPENLVAREPATARRLSRLLVTNLSP